MAQQLPPQFFTPWDPAPHFAPKPSDVALEQRVSKLAEFAAKNGPPFVSMIREKQQGNPEYDFLSGGPGSEYFTWKLYCFLYNHSPDQPLQLNPGQPAPHHSQQSGPTQGFTSPNAQPDYQHVSATGQDPRQTLEQAVLSLPPEVDSEFATVLANLSGTRASIKESKEWFMARLQHANGLAAKMAFHQQQLPTYDQHLHVIYLANDVLLKSVLQRGIATDFGSDAVAVAFQPALPLMLNAAFVAGNASQEVQQRLATILDHWAIRQVYPEQVIQGFKQAMVQGPAGQAPPLQGTGEAPPHSLHQPWEQPPQGSSSQPWSQPGLSPPAGMGMPPPQHHLAPHLHNQQQQHGFQQPQQPGILTHPQQAFPPPQTAPHFAPQQPPPPRRAHRGWDSGPSQPIPPPQPFYSPQDAYSFPVGQPGYGPPGQPGFVAGMPPGSLPVQPGFPPPGYGRPPAAAPPASFPAAAMHMPPPDLVGLQPGLKNAVAPTDPMSFPPGLIPALVEENLRTEEPYAPLSKRDIERAGVPGVAEPDAYLLARLDKFYAELQDYRPGTSRADFEDDQRRQRTRNALGEKGRKILSSGSERGSKGPSDGSYRGERREGGPAGLGFGNAPAEFNSNDPFNQYRKQRSGYYHDAITRATASANEPQPVR